MKKILSLLFSVASLLLSAQSIQPQVINSAGDHRQLGSSGITITDNIGEPFVATLNGNNFIVTQGFLQPDLLSKAGPAVSVLKTDVSCADKKDGKISVALSNVGSNHQIVYAWSPSTVCPANNCSSLDSLSAGTYSLIVFITNLSTMVTDSVKPAPVVINDNNGPCSVTIFNGVTPNGDGENDIFLIENIEEFPDNRVTIYNRWGGVVYDTKGYNNRDKAWPEQRASLTASTYFYVIDLGNGTKPLKGWVELISN